MHTDNTHQTVMSSTFFSRIFYGNKKIVVRPENAQEVLKSTLGKVLVRVMPETPQNSSYDQITEAAKKLGITHGDRIPKCVSIGSLSVVLPVAVAKAINSHKEHHQERLLRIGTTQILDNNLKNRKPLVQGFIVVDHVASPLECAGRYGNHAQLSTTTEIVRKVTNLSDGGSS